MMLKSIVGSLLALFSPTIILAADIPDQFGDVNSAFNTLIYDTVIPIIFGILGAIFIIIGIIRASKIAFADNEDSKKKAVKSMIWFGVGAVLCFVVAMLVPAVFKYLQSNFKMPTNPTGALPVLALLFS